MTPAMVADPHSARLDYTRRITRVYIRCLLFFVLLSVVNNVSQLGTASDYVARRAMINSVLILVLLTTAFLFARFRRLDLAVGTLVITFIALSFVTAFFHGIGVRAPIMGLAALGIGLAHFQFGQQVAGKITAFCILLVGSAWLAEYTGLIPGAVGQLFPPSINAALILVVILVLSYLTAAEMQARSDFSLSAIEAHNDALQVSIEETRRNQQSQDLFFAQVTPELLAHCEQLATLCNRLSEPDLPPSQLQALLDRIKELNATVVQQFESAVGAVEHPVSSA